MRWLYVVGEAVPGDGGGSVHAGQVAAGLVARGHDVTCICHQDGGREPEETWRGVRLLRTPMGFAGRRFPIKALPVLQRLRGETFDVVMERQVTFGGAGVRFARRRGLPLVLEVNAPHLDELLFRVPRLRAAAPVLRWWSDRQFAAADLCIAPVESIVPEHARDTVTTLGWAADVEAFRPDAGGPAARADLRRAHGIPADAPVLVFTGTFRPWHGAEVLPPMLAALDADPAPHLLLAGDGPGLPEVERAADAAGVADRVHLPGRVPHGDVPALLAACDVALAPFRPSAYEPLRTFGFYWSPLKVFEAMAAGLPVAATACGDLPELLRDAGATVPEEPGADLPERLAAAVAPLLADPDARARAGAIGRRRVVAEHSWSGHVEALEAAVESMLRRRS